MAVMYLHLHTRHWSQMDTNSYILHCQGHVNFNIHFITEVIL